MEPESERRVICETGLAGRLAVLTEPVLESLGLRLVHIHISGGPARRTLRIMAEREDGTMPIDDCARASRALGPVLDMENGLSFSYNLEMSSPGIDRPLVRRSDFCKWQGFEVKIALQNGTGDRRNYRGVLGLAEGDGIIVENIADTTGPSSLHLSFSHMESARLIMTERLLATAGKPPRPAPCADAPQR